MNQLPSGYAAALWIIALVGSGCDTDVPSVVEDPAPRGATEVDFAVRGRWHDPSALTYRIEDRGSPIPRERWRHAVDRALGVWQRSGAVGFSPAANGTPADVVLSWHQGRHGPCEPFGATTASAHAGPVRSGTYVHFDRERAWSEDGAVDDTHSVFHTALHELGHVLGLGHSTAADSIMVPGETRGDQLSRSELAALHTLYGGGSDQPGDLWVRGEGDVQHQTLRQVAPPERTDFAVFDVNGDGDDELLIWRTDRAGHGGLTIYDFVAKRGAGGPVLNQTLGPMPGVVAAGADVGFAVIPDTGGSAATRLVLCRYPNDRVVALQFEPSGLLRPFPLPAGFDAKQGEQRREGDLDGDGATEQVVRVQ